MAAAGGVPLGTRTCFFQTTPSRGAFSDEDLQIERIWGSIQEQRRLWVGDLPLSIPGFPKDRKEFWGIHAIHCNRSAISAALDFFRTVQGSSLLDLGCGNSYPSDLFLERGWSVIGVDSSAQALQKYGDKHRAERASGKLLLVEADVNQFECADSSVDGVIAIDLLSYVDPSQFQALWMKISQWIKKGGFFAGTMFREVEAQEVYRMKFIREQGAWLLRDQRMVRTLLEQTGYEVLKVELRVDDPDEVPMAIQFIARKR